MCHLEIQKLSLSSSMWDFIRGSLNGQRLKQMLTYFSVCLSVNLLFTGWWNSEAKIRMYFQEIRAKESTFSTLSLFLNLGSNYIRISGMGFWHQSIYKLPKWLHYEARRDSHWFSLDEDIRSSITQHVDYCITTWRFRTQMHIYSCCLKPGGQGKKDSAFRVSGFWHS